MGRVRDNAILLFRHMAEYEKFPGDPDKGRHEFTRDELAEQTKLLVRDVEEAVEMLADDGLAEIEDVLGPDAAISLTAEGRDKYDDLTSPKESNRVTPDDRTLFVVHGRDDIARRAIFDFLRALGANPLEWEEAVALSGSALPHNASVVKAAFARAQAILVIFTGDDYAHIDPRLLPPGDNEEQPMLQPRPNVFFEAGMAYQFDSQRTIIVEIGVTRRASDLDGLNTVRLTTPGDEAQFRNKLASRLETAGVKISRAKNDWLSAGNLSGALGRVAATAQAPARAKHANAATDADNLLERVRGLTVGDEVTLESCRRRIRTFLERKAPTLVSDLDAISFHPMRITRVGERVDAAAWAEGQNRLERLLLDVKEDLGDG